MSISFDALSFGYDAPSVRTLDHVTAELPAGDIVLVLGPSGCGKSTLLRSINGLVPHSTGGWISGDVTVHGRSVRAHKPRDLANTVGFVHQDPEAQFVVDEVEGDIAFVLENLDFDATAMRRRVEEVLDALGVAALRHRSPATLSGGERQRCAIAGALAAAPAVLVLDEPTSQLDPQGAEDVLGALTRINADLGTTLVIAEHRLERIATFAHRAIEMEAGRVTRDGDPVDVLRTYHGAPPVVRLGRTLGWDPVPLTVRDARRHVGATELPSPEPMPPHAPGASLARATGVTVELGPRRALHDCSFEIAEGEIVALIGRNGAGKTTLLRTLAGLVAPKRGNVDAGSIGYVPQDPNLLFTAPTVREELQTTLRLLGRRDFEAIAVWLDRLHLHPLAERHPRSLSGGERQRVAIAAVAVGHPRVLLLDEPTRGIDGPSRDALVDALHAHTAPTDNSAAGAVVLATHDIDLAARVATRVVVLADGEVIADGEARTVLEGSLFAPAVMRVVPPFLTVEEVDAAVRAHE